MVSQWCINLAAIGVVSAILAVCQAFYCVAIQLATPSSGDVRHLHLGSTNNVYNNVHVYYVTLKFVECVIHPHLADYCVIYPHFMEPMPRRETRRIYHVENIIVQNTLHLGEMREYERTC